MTAAEPRLVFGSSMEGMLRCLGTPVAPSVQKKLKDLGVDTSRAMLPAYPLEVYVKVIDLVGEVRHPGLRGDARDEALGRDFIRGFQSTVIGRATLALAGVLGPRRATQRLTRTMRTVNNYSNSGCTELSPTAMAVWCEPVLRPHYYLGVFREAGQLMHGDKYRAELQRVAGERAEFVVSWG